MPCCGRAVSTARASCKGTAFSTATIWSASGASRFWRRTSRYVYKDVKINLIDTPGHADFGGEVERVLRMADGALVLVDAAEGPMPQTRFVLSKALECRLQPIVIVNKVDRQDARSLEVLDEVFNLFLELGADDKLADFPYLFGSGRGGYLSHDPEAREGDLTPLLDLILERVPGPEVDVNAPLQMLVTTLDWSDFVGRIAIGRLQAGKISKNQTVALMQAGDQDAQLQDYAVARIR